MFHEPLPQQLFTTVDVAGSGTFRNLQQLGDFRIAEILDGTQQQAATSFLGEPLQAAEDFVVETGLIRY